MPEPSRWAVVVGIDHYSSSDPGENLRGAANDAVLVYRFLCNSMNIPENNIRLHLARDPSFLPTIPDPPSAYPTLTGVLKSIDHVIANAKPGDLVHIHFSGHGSRESTNHPEKKSETGLDELLCFVDYPLDDVEFGQKLDYMSSSPQNLIVSVTLDCCFSGGATRADCSGIRCMPRDLPNSRAVYKEAEKSAMPSAGTARNATIQKGWLYRDRDYNVMAACQPFEEAGERPDSTGDIHGIFTSSLVSQMHELGDRRSFTTYGEFQGVLDAAMKGLIRRLGVGIDDTQQPMLLGPRERVLFDSITLDSSQKLCHVIGVSRDLVTLDRGQASGARLSDSYRLWHPGKARTRADQGEGIEVAIVLVREYESDARVIAGSGVVNAIDLRQAVQIGWAAEIVRRADVARARVVDDGTSASTRALKEIQNHWRSFVDPAAPIHLDFSQPTQNSSAPRFHVNVREAALDITDAKGKPFDHLPSIPTDSTDAGKLLMRVLGHLQAFLCVAEMAPPGKAQHNASVYSASLTEAELPEDDGSVVSTWLVNIQNLSQKVIYVVIFNLTPLYGIGQIIPRQVGCGHPIEPGDNMSTLVDIRVPEAITEQYHNNPEFRMTDTLKIFITADPIDLSHFALADLEVASGRGHEEARPPATSPGALWYVEEKQLITVFGA